MPRILTLLLSLALDLTLGDPPNRFHPVVLMGHWLNTGRRLAPAHNRFEFGLGWITAGLVIFTIPFFILNKLRLYSIHPSSFILHPLLLTPVFAYRNLRRRVAEVGTALTNDNLPEARHLTARHLVSRDTGQLTANEVAGAAIESLAENITDSVTAPLMAYMLGGLPAAWGYRFVNTADAMWGYRTAEFEQLGKFAARLDDALNWFPARLTGWLLVIAARLAGENSANAQQTMLTQHHLTSSPNAGWTMSAMAGAIGVTLSKREVYDLTGGPAQPTTNHISRALRIADIGVGLTVITLVVARLLYLFIRKKGRTTNDE